MHLFDELTEKREALRQIAARHGASNLRLFGSVLRREERPDSDIDFLIDMEENRGFDDYLALAEELEKLLGRRIDLVTQRSLSPFFRQFIEAEARPL